MKRVIGSFAALVLALTLGVAAYGRAPQQNSNTNTAPAAKVSKTKMRKTKKRTRRSSHHKTHRGTKKNAAKSPAKQ